MSSISWEIIARINRWWINPREILEDEQVARFYQSTVKWDPNIFCVDDLVDGVYTLRGPRQVGKTTMLKLFIKKLLDKKYDPNSIIYVPCDTFEKFDQLLRSLIHIKERMGERKIVLILDEVTLVNEWQRAVKIFVDQGLLKNVTIIACGSHAVDVKKGATYLVGRRGDAKHPIDRIMLPMDFREYVEILEPKLVNGVAKLTDITAMNPLKREALIERLYSLFEKYLITGGFPRVVDEYNKNNQVSKSTTSDFINYLSRDITRLGKSESTARAMISAIIKQRCNPTSWNSIAREIGISQPTAKEYGELLSQMYLIRPIYRPNRTFTRQEERKDKKLIMRDPFLYHIGTIWGWGFPEIDIEPREIIIQNIEREQQHIVEMIVLEHIARNNITYYWKPNRELDAIVIKDREARGIEIKWREKISRNEIRETIRTYSKLPLKKEKLIIVTKKTYQEQNNTLLIPAPLFLIIKGQKLL